MQSDKLIGRETIPVLVGKTGTKVILNIISAALFAVLVFSYFAGWTSALGLFLLTCVLYMWICLSLCDRKSGLSGAVTEGLLETVYIIAGLCVVVWSFF
jgi:4-hydroxy-3-methylbut-2-enyl diphosphate reductase